MGTLQPKIFIIPLILLIFNPGCVKLPYEAPERVSFKVPESIDPEEMYRWEPPSEAELEARRARQRELDALAADIEALILKFNEMDIAARNLEAGSSSWSQKLAELDRDMMARLAEIEKKNAENKERLTGLSGEVGDLDKLLQDLLRARQLKLFRMDDYKLAYRLFRQRKYSGAASQFIRVLNTRYPSKLRDNILFGLGASYYKLKRWDKAARSLSTVINQIQNGDKWYEASLLLGLTHYRNSRRSQALYVLHRGLERNPPPSVRNLMEKLERQIQEDPVLVTAQ